jgi:hypothetical protein
MISNGQEKALRQILVNYANDDNAIEYEVIQAITSILGCDGEVTLRDQFAMAAMQGIIAHGGFVDAATAYKIANDMIEARK